MRNLAGVILVLTLAACGNAETSNEQTGTNAAVSTADAQVALGLTERQLLDADIIDANGTEIGDIEGIVRNSDGTVNQLLVEIEDTSPDRYVHMSLEGLEAVTAGNGRDVRTRMTREQLMALPEVRR
jgi:sporulation protein YlmC with PRC-barrel domain